MLPNTTPPTNETTHPIVPDSGVRDDKPTTPNQIDALRATISQTQQAVSRYGASPYELSGTIQQLKATYLAQQYHIGPNTREQ